jgi:ABC-2 type transport system ATP-binding protein
MRQRLGLAMACVGSPRYLVLDEPMNGLDTEGIGWVKALLRHVADDGAGVLISTHLIGEIEDLADRVVVIDRGRVVIEADPRELGSTQTLVRSVDDAELIRALESAGHTASATDNGVVTAAPTDVVGRIALLAAISLVELRQERVRLASFVLDNTTGEFASQGRFGLPGVTSTSDAQTPERSLP